MKKWITAVTVIALAALCLAAQEKDKPKASPGQIGGEWALSMDTPHGNVNGTLQVKQEGAAVTGTLEAEIFGTLPMKGSVDGNKVELVLDIPAAQMKFKLTGTLDGKTMSGATEMGGAWKAARK